MNFEFYIFMMIVILVWILMAYFAFLSWFNPKKFIDLIVEKNFWLIGASKPMGEWAHSKFFLWTFRIVYSLISGFTILAILALLFGNSS